MSQKNMEFNNININEFSSNYNTTPNQTILPLFKHCLTISINHNLQIFICIRDHNRNLSILSTKETANTFISHDLALPIYASQIYDPSNMNDLFTNEDDFNSVYKDTNAHSDFNFLTTQSHTQTKITENERHNKVKRHTIRIMCPNFKTMSNNHHHEEFDFVQGANKKSMLLLKKRNETYNTSGYTKWNNNKSYMKIKTEDKGVNLQPLNVNSKYKPNSEYTSSVPNNNEYIKQFLLNDVSSGLDIDIKEDNNKNTNNNKTKFDELFNFKDEDDDNEIYTRNLLKEKSHISMSNNNNNNNLYCSNNNDCISSVNQDDKYDKYDKVDCFNNVLNDYEGNLSFETKSNDFGFNSFFDT